jgi:hypothetical protein
MSTTVYDRCGGSHSTFTARYGSKPLNYNDENNNGETFENIRKNNYDGLAIGDFWDIFFGGHWTTATNASEFHVEDCKWMVNKYDFANSRQWTSKSLKWFFEIQYAFYEIMKGKTDYSNTTQWTDEHVEALRFYEEHKLQYPNGATASWWWFAGGMGGGGEQVEVSAWATATLTALQAVGRAGASGVISGWTDDYNKKTDFYKRVHEKADTFIKNGGQWEREEGKVWTSPTHISCRAVKFMEGIPGGGGAQSEGHLWRYFATLDGDDVTTKTWRSIHESYRWFTMASGIPHLVSDHDTYRFVTFQFLEGDKSDCNSGEGNLHFMTQDDNNDFYVKIGATGYEALVCKHIMRM